MEREPKVALQLQAVRTDLHYQIKVCCYFSVNPKVDSCVFRAVARDFTITAHIFRNVLELGSVCSVSTRGTMSGIKKVWN